MKSCPACNRTFADDTITFCLVDGSILSAPYDPQATRNISEESDRVPQPTLAVPTEALPHKTLQATIAAPLSPIVESQLLTQPVTRSQGTETKLKKIVPSVITGAIIGAVVAVIYHVYSTTTRGGYVPMGNIILGVLIYALIGAVAAVGVYFAWSALRDRRAN